MSGDLSPPARLSPADGVSAIIVLDDGRYVLQLRDERPDIFFPGYWCLFGGTIDEGEDERDAVERELREELGLRSPTIRHLMRFQFDLSPMGLGTFIRSFFEIPVPAAMLGDLRLTEGQALRAWTPAQALSLHPMTPYDEFALWWHANRSKVRSA